jgi:hypothetical protein
MYCKALISLSAVALIALAASTAAQAGGHHQNNSPDVRDHRGTDDPVVRDHRGQPTGIPISTGQNTGKTKNDPDVRDHR